MNTQNEKGAVLITSFFILLVIMVIGAGLLETLTRDMDTSDSEKARVQTFYVAQSGIEKAIADVRSFYTQCSVPSSEQLAGIEAPVFDDFAFEEYSVVKEGGAYQSGITEGPYKGMTANIQPIRINVLVADELSGAKVELTQSLQAQSMYIFQFGIFYDEDLEILPGPDMVFSGPVHSNGDIYVGCNNNLWFDSYVTCVGNIFHDRKNDPGSVSNGTIKFSDDTGNYKTMYCDGRWLDSTQADWADAALERWGGEVLSGVHGVDIMTPPISAADDLHDIIERASADDSLVLSEAKYANKAGLKIVDGVITDSSGDVVSVDSGTIDNSSFYDFREGFWMSSVDVDLQKLQESGAVPSNGIIYISSSSVKAAVRIVNGGSLPSGGLTVVSDNPIYILGDYNSMDKKPAAIIADTVNVLSNNWCDGNSNKSLSKRTASNTTVNAAIMTGNTDTTVGSYNGGLENLIRFLENWSGRTLTYNGSLVCLWNSEQSLGNWSSASYNPPNRNWSYDSSFDDPDNMPPGTPIIYTIQRVHWSIK